METMIAYCGLTCDNCPIHLATMEQDKLHQQTMRESIADECSKLYGMKMQPEDITDCDGCRAKGRLFSGCKDCEIRKCAVSKNFKTCADCDKMETCATLGNLVQYVPEALANLKSLN